jgi:hypothetical protein
MKIFLTLFLLAVLFFGCSEKKVPDKEQEKVLFDEVIKIHDKVMGSDEELMKNKLLLDSAVKHNIEIAKDSAKIYADKLNLADSAMSNWMHKFDAENAGKSHGQIMDYLANQKKQIMAVDTQIATAVNGSSKYLTKIKMK